MFRVGPLTTLSVGTKVEAEEAFAGRAHARHAAGLQMPRVLLEPYPTRVPGRTCQLEPRQTQLLQR